MNQTFNEMISNMVETLNKIYQEQDNAYYYEDRVAEYKRLGYRILRDSKGNHKVTFANDNIVNAFNSIFNGKFGRKR